MKKKFSSFEALGRSMGIKPKPSAEPPTKRCFQCGAEMRLIPGTNVYVCGCTQKDGKPCQKYILTGF